MLCIHFGELRSVVDRRGNNRQVGEWALHLQCPWRFVQFGDLVLASSDFYYDAETGEKLDRDSDQESVFHRNMKRLNLLIESGEIVVSIVQSSEAGAFDLIFDRDLKLSVMPVESGGEKCGESWRFFQPSLKTPHFVFPK
jgi:hypothetical protein